MSVEATANNKLRASDGPDAKDNPQLLSAEQCLATMRKRIKIIHGVSTAVTGKLSISCISAAAVKGCVFSNKNEEKPNKRNPHSICFHIYAF